jgi:hypothetical protein
MFASRNRVISYRHPVLFCAAALMSSVLATGVHAQRYETIPVKLDAREGKSLQTVFFAALRNPAGLGASQEDVDKFLKQYYFPLMTSTSDEALGNLSKGREDLFKYITQAASPSTQQYLIDLTLNVARVLARGNYHPASRYNAVLMLGELDQQLGTATAPPVPHAKATQDLLELVEEEQFNKIPVPESVKLGALLGLERHARYGINPQLNERITKAMLAVIASKTPEDVETEVHDWVRSAAAQVLANQYAKGPTKEVQAALTGLIADAKTGLDDRCEVAGVLWKITYAPGADIDGNAATDALAQLTLDVVTNAANLARDYQKEALSRGNFDTMRSGGYGGGGGRGRRGGGYGGEYGGGGGYGGEEETGPQFERRELFARLYNIGTGGNSLKAGLADDAKGRIEAMIAEMKPAMQSMEDKNATEVDVSSRVIELEANLKTLIESWGKPVAAAETDSADEATGFAGAER